MFFHRICQKNDRILARVITARIVCQICGVVGYLQHIVKNYYRTRHYVGFKNGKPLFKYHRQDPEHVFKLLRQIDQSDQNNIDHPGQTNYLEVEVNRFKSENKAHFNQGSGSIVRSSIVASRVISLRRKPPTRVRIPAGAP
jgi:hypothetical protein